MTTNREMTMDDRPIAVLGATGKTGRRLVRRLRGQGRPVRALSRSGETRFDWFDESTWDAAVTGAGALYLVCPTDPGPVPAFVRRAADAGVERFVALSGRGAEHFGTAGVSFGVDMVAGEAAVRESGASWTVVRANNFSQNFDEDLFHAPLVAGRLALPIDDTPEPFVDVEDVADVAAALLTGREHDGEVIELSGPRGISFREAVATIAEAAGREIRFVELDREEYVKELVDEGWSEADAETLTQMFDLMRRGALAEPADGVERVLGRPAADFESYVARTAATGAWAGA
ncbi:NmrA family NAD(P)-binding protein [Actinomadura kijaniata]|uniref:NmrA family NAD(P)-binding protein n=1 Tax=Actinomadura kijaniata TaxID=46161 RepID=UPI003F1CB953